MDYTYFRLVITHVNLGLHVLTLAGVSNKVFLPFSSHLYLSAHHINIWPGIEGRSCFIRYIYSSLKNVNIHEASYDIDPHRYTGCLVEPVPFFLLFMALAKGQIVESSAQWARWGEG